MRRNNWSIIVCAFIGMFLFGIAVGCKPGRTYHIAGKVTSKFTLARGKSDDDLFIVVYSDSMHQKVPIEVTMSTYINHDVGEYIEFDLDQFDIDRALNY